MNDIEEKIECLDGKRVSIFVRLNEKYGKEDVHKRIDDMSEVPTGGFYRFERNEQVLIKQQPVAIYSPTKFKYSDDGWGYIGSLQRYEEITTSKETGEGALVYPFGLRESQLWNLIGQIKGVFPLWSPEIDENLKILENLLIDINVNPFTITKSNGEVEERIKIRFYIVKDGDGKDGYRNRLEWLNKRTLAKNVKIEKYEL